MRNRARKVAYVQRVSSTGKKNFQGDVCSDGDVDFHCSLICSNLYDSGRFHQAVGYERAGSLLQAINEAFVGRARIENRVKATKTALKVAGIGGALPQRARRAGSSGTRYTSRLTQNGQIDLKSLASP